jgi:predicted transcriptional regulator
MEKRRIDTIQNICKILHVLEDVIDYNGATLSEIQKHHNFRETYMNGILQIMADGGIIECYWGAKKNDFIYRITLAGLQFMLKYEKVI